MVHVSLACGRDLDPDQSEKPLDTHLYLRRSRADVGAREAGAGSDRRNQHHPALRRHAEQGPGRRTASSGAGA